MKRITACTLDCPDACSLVFSRGKDKARIRGNPDHPFTKGFCCPKGAALVRRALAEDRIVHPLLKQNGRFERVSWDEALDLCARRISELRTRPETLLHIHGHGYRGILAQASSHFFAALGACSTRGALCDDTGIEASILDFGSLNHNSPFQILNADRIVNWGKDLKASSIHTAALVREARDNGARVLTVSPGEDANASLSDHTVRIRPGTDRFLAVAVAKLLIDQGLLPHVAARSSNFPTFRAVADSITLGQCLEACEVSEIDARTLARWYAAPGPLTAIIGWGVQRYVFGGENIRFINALSFVSGQVGRPGAGVFFNISSARNLASWGDLMPEPGNRKLLSLPRIGREMLDANPMISMAWVDGINVVNQAPDAATTARAFEAVPFTVVVDAFMNDTAMRADLILPCALPLEREEILGSCLHNYVNYSAKVMEPRGEARSDFEILADLGARLDPPLILPDAETCLARGLDSPYLSTTLEEIRAKGFARAEHPDVAFENMVFCHPDGKYRLPEAVHPEPRPDPGYPLMLLSFIEKRAMHSQIPESEQREIPVVLVSEACPCLEGLDLEAEVYLASPVGRIRVRVETSPTLHPEAVLIRRGRWMKKNGCANPVIAPLITDISGSAAYYSQTARLENG